MRPKEAGSSPLKCRLIQLAERYSSSCAGVSRDVFAGKAAGAGPLICAVIGNGVSARPPQRRKNSFLRPSPRLAA
jgi:hypothetical protein